jgi:hypothetical protein
MGCSLQKKIPFEAKINLGFLNKYYVKTKKKGERDRVRYFSFVLCLKNHLPLFLKHDIL